MEKLFKKTMVLFKKIISTPSVSGEENLTADIIEEFLIGEGYEVTRIFNNVMARSSCYMKDQQSILLNSHHDTIKPVSGWERDPFSPDESDGKIFGLGSNDAAGSLIALLTSFIYLERQVGFNKNIIFIASAEEEISGTRNIESILPQADKISFGIVGEPTNMHLAIAEKGLLVLDCLAKGKSAHVSRNVGDNAIYKAMIDIEKLKNYSFNKHSPLLGDVKITVSQINAGTNHNVIPDECRFVVDVRANELYTNENLLKEIKQLIDSEVSPRSIRLNSSSIDINHPLVQKAISQNIPLLGSPAISDQVFMNFPTVKIGPGDPARSHTANEYIYTEEIRQGIKTYIDLCK